MWVAVASTAIVVGIAATLVPVWAPVFMAGLFGKILVTLLLVLGGVASIAVLVAGAVATRKRGVLSDGQFIYVDHSNNSYFYLDVQARFGDEIHQSLANYTGFS